MSQECKDKVKEIFDLFDVDGSKRIDKEEAVKHWKNGFSKISAMEFFNTVDVNKDGEVEWEEFIQFWE